MLKKIKGFFNQNLLSSPSPADRQKQLHIATAALLFEVARADFDISRKEKDKIASALNKTLKVDSALLDEIMQLAENEVEQATSLHQFTKLIHDNYKLDEKTEIIRLLWLVAYSDNELDKYEESLIRKVADLLYIPHGDYISTKNSALKELKISLPHGI